MARWALAGKLSRRNRGQPIPLTISGPEPGREAQRQSLPAGDEQAEFRVERVEVGGFAARRETKLVSERGRFEPPIALERIGAGAGFAAAEIEPAAAALASPAHDFPASVGRVQPAVPVTAPIAGSGALPPPYDAANFVDSSPIAPAFLSSLAGRRRFRAAVEPTFRIASVGRVQPAVSAAAPIAGGGAFPPPYDAANFVDFVTDRAGLLIVARRSPEVPRCC